MKYLLLDIDGAFNPFLASDLRERNFISYQNGWVNWHIDLNHHASWMREIEGQTNIVWASTWEEESNHLAAMFGMEDANLPHISLQMTTAPTWKLHSIKTWVEENVERRDRVVWINDEIHNDAFAWADEHPHVKIIKSNPAIGLTLEDWNGARRFLKIKDLEQSQP
jgi:hypothetical protein